MLCTACSAEMPEHSGFCPACGQAVGGTPISITVPVSPTDRLLAACSYVTVIPAIVFLLMEPYSKNRYVRFHSLQCLFACGALVIVAVALGILIALLSLLPFVGHLLSLIAWPIFSIGCFFLWVVLLVKAYQGDIFKLPLIGNWAERRAMA
jgi:uncharacterized membrane protein